MSNVKKDAAKAYAKLGFFVMPCKADSKLPMLTAWQKVATRDPAIIDAWWDKYPDANIGLVMGKFKALEYVVAVDIDNKTEENIGDVSVAHLAAEDKALPVTLQTRTPTGGRHMFYLTEAPVSNKIGFRDGIDVKGENGYVIGGYSVINGAAYIIDGASPIAKAPAWLEKELSDRPVAAPRVSEVIINEADPVMLRHAKMAAAHAPIAVEGENGDNTTFKIAARLRDYGLSQTQCLEVLQEHWNPRCNPPWSDDELDQKISNVYRYAKNTQGCAVEYFEDVPVVEPEQWTERPIDAEKAVDYLNSRHAFVLVGQGHHIAHETVDEFGDPKFELMKEATFHAMYAGYEVPTGSGKAQKFVPATQVWMKSQGKRRTYHGLAFSPDGSCGSNYYNMWTGFSVKPLDNRGDATPAQEWMLSSMLEHIHVNISRGDEALAYWLLNFVAHMIQFPGEKPQTALVFKGEKGTGKSAMLKWIGELCGRHYTNASASRYLTGQFNAHLQATLMFALEEAYWPGDKAHEGVLKSLITSDDTLVELKGKEPYKVRNLVRIFMSSNEDWVAPASADERRFAVYEVGNGRQNDRQFFAEIDRIRTQEGGNRLLMWYFKNFTVDKKLVNMAPSTKGLLAQKEQSFSLFEQFWYDSLRQGRWAGGKYMPDSSDFTSVPLSELMSALSQYAKDRNIHSRLPAISQLERDIRKFAPHASVDGDTFVSNGLDALRYDFNLHLRQEVNWRKNHEQQ